MKMLVANHLVVNCYFRGHVRVDGMFVTGAGSIGVRV